MSLILNGGEPLSCLGDRQSKRGGWIVKELRWSIILCQQLFDLGSQRRDARARLVKVVAAVVTDLAQRL